MLTTTSSYEDDIDDDSDKDNNKITFKQTRSLSNAVCFKPDNNVCACAVSALFLLSVVNLSLKMDSVTSTSYMTWKVSPFDAAFRLFWRFCDFLLRVRSFDHTTTSSKI